MDFNQPLKRQQDLLKKDTLSANPIITLQVIHFTNLVFVKVPGRYSGFLAMDSVRAARNAHICLVPEFGYDLYGDHGLLNYIAARIQAKGHCIIVYSEGASYAARDIPQ